MMLYIPTENLVDLSLYFNSLSFIGEINSIEYSNYSNITYDDIYNGGIELYNDYTNNKGPIYNPEDIGYWFKRRPEPINVYYFDKIAYLEAFEEAAQIEIVEDDKVLIGTFIAAVVITICSLTAPIITFEILLSYTTFTSICDSFIAHNSGDVSPIFYEYFTQVPDSGLIKFRYNPAPIYDIDNPDHYGYPEWWNDFISQQNGGWEVIEEPEQPEPEPEYRDGYRVEGPEVPFDPNNDHHYGLPQFYQGGTLGYGDNITHSLSDLDNL